MTQPNREQINELLSAYVDGETDPRETEFVEHLLERDESVRGDLEALRGTAHLVERLPRHPSPPSIKEDIRNRIEREALLGTPEDSPAGVSSTGVPRGAWLSMAAMIGLVAIAGVWILRDRESPGRRGDRFAQLDPKSAETWQDVLEVEKVSPAPRRERSSRKASSPPPGPSQTRSKERMKRSPASRSRTTSRREDSKKDAPKAIVKKQAKSAQGDAIKVEEKRARGTDVAAPGTHRFANERLTLRIAVADEASRQAAVRNLKVLLARRNAPPIAGRETHTATSKSMNQAFYHKGAARVNYVDAKSTRALVRGTARDLASLVDELARVTKTEDISLIAGPLVFRGLKETRHTLLAAVHDGLAQGGVEATMPRPTMRDADRTKKPEAEGSKKPDSDGAEDKPIASPKLEGLLEMFGVDPKWIRLASAVQERKTIEDRPSLVERGLESVGQAGAAKPEPAHDDVEVSRPVFEGQISQRQGVMASERYDRRPGDAYVTLVIEFVVARKDRPRARPTPAKLKEVPGRNSKARPFQK